MRRPWNKSNLPEPGVQASHWTQGDVCVVKTDVQPGCLTDTLIKCESGSLIWIACRDLHTIQPEDQKEYSDV